MAESVHKNGNDLAERAVALFQPDPTVADEYLDTVRARASLEPEKRLMLAVLEDTVGFFKNIFSPVIEKAELCSGKSRNGFLKKITDGSSHLKTLVKLWGWTRDTCVKDYCVGRKKHLPSSPDPTFFIGIPITYTERRI